MQRRHAALLVQGLASLALYFLGEEALGQGVGAPTFYPEPSSKSVHRVLV